MFCLICTPEFLRAADSRDEGVHIKQNTSPHVATIICNALSCVGEHLLNPKTVPFHLYIEQGSRNHRGKGAQEGVYKQCTGLLEQWNGVDCIFLFLFSLLLDVNVVSSL